jgi:hypothetical protein
MDGGSDTPLRNFLVEVAQDPELSRKLTDKEERDALIDGSDLDDHNKQLLRDGDLIAIRDELTRESGREARILPWVVRGWVVIV